MVRPVLATSPAMPSRASKRIVFFSWEMTDQSSQFSLSYRKILTRSASSISFVLIVTNSKRETTSPAEVICLYSSRTARSFSLELASGLEVKLGVGVVGSLSIGPSLAYRGKYCQRGAQFDNAVH